MEVPGKMHFDSALESLRLFESIAVDVRWKDITDRTADDVSDVTAAEDRKRLRRAL